MGRCECKWPPYCERIERRNVAAGRGSGRRAVRKMRKGVKRPRRVWQYSLFSSYHYHECYSSNSLNGIYKKPPVALRKWRSGNAKASGHSACWTAQIRFPLCWSLLLAWPSFFWGNQKFKFKRMRKTGSLRAKGELARTLPPMLGVFRSDDSTSRFSRQTGGCTGRVWFASLAWNVEPLKRTKSCTVRAVCGAVLDIVGQHFAIGGCGSLPSAIVQQSSNNCSQFTCSEIQSLNFRSRLTVRGSFEVRNSNSIISNRNFQCQ